MAVFMQDMFAKPDDEAGIFMDDLGRALVTWAAMQNRTVTVADAAMSFNTTPEIIREAVEGASWFYASDESDPMKQTLELDGD